MPAPQPPTSSRPDPKTSPKSKNSDTILVRYSSNGELPWSTVLTLAFHLVVILLIIVLTVKLQTPDRKPPTVDTVHVAEADSSAAGDAGDTLAADGNEGLEQSNQPEQPAPVTPAPTEKIQEVEVDIKPITPDAGPVKADTSSAVQQANAAVSAAQNLKNKVGKNLGKGSGGGGGSSATGRAARPSRWVLLYNSSSGADALAQFESLGAVVAVPDAGDRFRYYSNLTSSPPTSTTKDIKSESRLYWINEDPGACMRITQALGIASTPLVVIFLPLDLEQRMSDMELSFRNLEEDQIQSTRFELVRRGGGYDVIVSDQIPKRGT